MELLYDDDVVFSSEDKDGLERQVQAWCDRLAMFGLKLNVKKTEYLTTDVTESSSIKVNDNKIPRTLTFSLVQVAFVDSRYGAECWPATKVAESRLSVMETKMLRWTGGVTRMDRIRNDAIRQKFGVAPIADKMREARLRWYSHVSRGKEDSVRKKGLNFEVIGKRPKERPKKHWSDTLHMDLKVVSSSLI
ncbi:unnamed protein product [Heligmosomoides polygyrus]|uniref:Reverse transcriptase domain-containing protein n=1 Tax=Heligmosomoides polygyrus TaxID=6339 RepID=A0A183FSN6_HELPZ|nr:unnamed protein product [Heligmosomoides polygyrus]